MEIGSILVSPDAVLVTGERRVRRPVLAEPRWCLSTDCPSDSLIHLGRGTRVDSVVGRGSTTSGFQPAVRFQPGQHGVEPRKDRIGGRETVNVPGMVVGNGQATQSGGTSSRDP